MFWILLFLSIIIVAILFHQDFNQIIQFYLQKKIGLKPIEDWNVSFKNYRLIISITGIKLHLISKPVHNKKKKKRDIILLRLLRFIFRYITIYFQLNIHDILITKDTFELSLNHLSVQQQNQKILATLGPLQLFNQDLTLIDMITPCTLSFELKQSIDIDFVFGKFVIYADNCMELASTRKRLSSSSSPSFSPSLNVTQALNSMRVTIDSICFIHPTKFNCTINQIILNALGDQSPLLSLKSKSISLTNSAIQCSIPTLELMVDRAIHSVAPYTQFISVTCIFNSALVNLSLHELKLFQKSSSSSSTDLKEEPKIFKDLPVCTLAVVFNSPELNLSLNDETEKIQAESWILRVSGEYVPKGTEEVPSASSTGSSSHLDALIAQEEYRLQTSHRMQLTTKWKQWMNRVGVQQQQQQQQQQGTQWSYRVSSKIMIHKLSVGKEFLNIKHAVLLLNLRLLVKKVEKDWYETMAVVEQGILQSEVSVDQPVVSLWNDEENTSLFWVATLPNYLRKKKSKSPAAAATAAVTAAVTTEKRKLIRHVNFSLEVNEGSIYVCSVDKAIKKETVPDGYIDNKPKQNVYSKIELTTKKINLVCSSMDWQIRCLLESLKVEQSSGVQVREMMIWVSQLDLVLKQNQVVCRLKKYGIIFSVQHHYVCLLLVKSLIQLKQHFPKKEEEEEEEENKKKKKEEKIPVHLDLSVARGDIHLLLPNEKQLYLRLDQLTIERKLDLTIKFRNMMLLGQSPSPETKSYWEQLIEFDQAQVSVKHRKLIEFKARKLFLRVPYNYILNTVTENVVGFIKAAKELHARILSNKTFTYFGPTCKNQPLLIPCIYIKTHVFSIQFDDDPFEAKLRNILRTGLLEQQKRLAYEDALQEKIQTMLSTSEHTTDEPSSTPNSPDLIEVHAQIAEAQKNLLHHLSQFWIKNINEQTQQEQQYYYDLHLRNYRNSMNEDEEDILDELQRPESSLFLIDILPLPLYPPLAHFCSQFVKISFKPADFPIDETRQFVHTIGGGVPLSNDFSALIPFHLSIKAGQTWIKVRDYPLPLLYVPSPQGTSATTGTMDDASSTKSRNQSRVSWCLEGNYVLGDELGASCGSRVILVPVIPNGYTLSVVRTASPIKFYSVVDYHILTSSMSTLCWSISYSPSIQDIARVLETIASKPKDPSSRLGFWDKVRFMIHTQTKLRFIGGGDLALVVKGTRDPYKLQGTGAGLTKIWSDDVVWLLGYDNPEHEFMQIVSKQYAFGVPDLIRGGFVPSLPGVFERKPVAMKEHNRFLKVVLKLTDGVRMGIGLAFERLGCNRCEKCQVAHRLNRCRTHTFSPHYNVLFQSFKQVEMYYDKETYDAYRGFRSDFVHLSLSIIKLNQASNVPCCQNAMYISPCFIEHFTSWYRLLGSPISIPMRRGNLFPRDQEKSKSFGEHLNTIKYKFVIKPLAIGFFCTDEETYMNVKGGGSAGLKATVVEFNVDIHQRREINKVDPSSKASMTFHELEVKLRDIDLRVIKASQLSRSRQEQEHQLFQWVDARDFVILDSVSYARQNQLPYKKIDVYPFAFSPLFYFVRQNDEGETNSRDYLRSTHDCGIGKGMDSHEFQKAHLQRRASDLDRVIEEHDKQLDIVLDAMQTMNSYEKEIADQHAALTEKLNYLSQSRYMLHTYLGQLILENELNMNDRDSPHTTTSSLGRRDELNRWETLMGPFQDRFFIHNPQIIWNNSVRDAVYYWQDIKSHRSVQLYNLSSRCLKFLQDLVDTAKKQQAWKPDVPLAEETQDMTQDLIDKLLSERLHNYVAYNETEENQPHQPANDAVFETSEENVNDPDYQYKSIPDLYEMKSKYLVDMINPQVNFQSDKGLDHLILFTNERILVKAFSIIDTCNNEAADKDVRSVKDRILVALDNAQLLVAKRLKDTKSTDGQSKNMHWAAWIQPEQLWYYRDAKYFDNFQRVASQLSGTVQLDRYNHLRIKINKYDSSRKSLFEDRTNTFELHFPQFKLVLNSQQAHVLYYTLINLLLGNEGSSSKKERLSKFKDVMLAAERSDLAETVKQVGVLQNRSRVLLALHKKFMHALPRLDSLGIREFNRNRKKMRENLEKLYLVVEAIRCIQTFRRDIHLEETDNAMRFSFTSDEIVWEALLNDDNDIKNTNSLCKWMLVNTKFVMLSKQNGSKRSTIEIERMQIMNTTDNPVFTNVLEAFVLQGQEVDFSRQKMLRGVLESLPPVGGIPIIQQLEINLLPLHLQISTAFGTIMKDYFFPRIMPDESQVQEESDESEESSDDEYDDDNDEDADMVSLEVASGTTSKIDTLSSTQSGERPLNRTLSRREGSFASFDLLTKKVKDTVIGKKKAKSDELTVMKNRSSTNRTFIYIRIPATKHCLSLRGPTQNTFYNMYNFPFKQPNLEYRNMTWSIAEMMEEIQKQFLRAALRHSPAFLKNKLMLSNKQPTPSTTTNTMTTITPTRSRRSSVSSKSESIAQRSRRPSNTTRSSYNTEEEDNDIKSLHSNDNADDELQRLIELQAVDKRISFNVDQELLDMYMKQYKPEEEKVNESVRKGRILFGESYDGFYYSNAGAAATAEIKTRLLPNKSRTL